MATSETTKANAHVNASVTDGNDYKANSRLVYESLDSRTKGYIAEFLKALHAILSSQTAPPASKFYALYLLTKAMENKNDELAAYLAKERSLLEILFRDAQTDGQKVMKDKGKKFFSKAPKNDEAVLGNNYMRLMLENFVHWSKIYKTEDKKNPMILFSVMFTNLQSRVKFPDDVIYIQKEYRVENGFHLIPAETLVPTTSKTTGSSPPKKPAADVLADSEIKEIHKQVLLTVPSGRDFKVHSPSIFQLVKKGSKLHNEAILAEIYDILVSKTYPSTFKFYALLLLVKITETKDEVFAAQLSEDKELLSKLASDARVDRDRPRQERGRTLFPGGDQEGVIGSNYHTLVLEAIQYWPETFLPSARNNTFLKFAALHTDLLNSERIEFPKENNFVRKNLKYEEDEADRSLSKRDLYPVARKSNDETLAQLQSAITSGNAYHANSGKIFAAIGKNNREYTASYVKATTAILKAKDTPPVSQFYATYLLLKLSETRNEVLTNELAYSEELLDDLSQKAQYDREVKGRTFFSSNPTEEQAKLGQNYVTLLQETFVTWKQSLTTNNKKDPTEVFNIIHSNLERKTRLPDQLYYAGKNPNTDDSHFPRKFELTYPNDQLDASRSKPNPAPSNVAASTSTPSGSGDIAALKKMKEGYGKYEQNKHALRDLLENNQEENEMKEVISYIGKDLATSYKTDVMPNVEPLLSSKDPQAARYVEQVFEEGATVDKITQELASYEKNRQGYPEFRRKVLPLVGSSQKEVASPQRTSSPVVISQQQQSPEQQKKSQFVASPKREHIHAGLEINPQKFYSHDMEEDIDSAAVRQKDVTKNMKSSEVISRQSAGSKPPVNQGQQRSKQSKAGVLEDDFEEDLMKQSSFRSSLRMSPGKKAFTEGDDLRNSMKLSRVKPNDLSNIESSIRNSFVNSGKKPPQFRQLNEMQVKEELEREIAKLKAEKEQLQKQNNQLTTLVKSGTGSQEDKMLIEELKTHLNQHSQWVEALQEENTALREELERLKSNKKYTENPNEEKQFLESKIKRLENELANSRVNPPVAGREQTRPEQHKSHRSSPPQGQPKDNELQYFDDDDDEGTERFETPLNDSGAAPTNYDVDWASTTQRPAVEPSEYDVDWPHQKEKSTSDWEIQRALNTKRSEEPKLIRGRVIDSNNPALDDLKKSVKGLPFSNDLHAFKLACLKPKCPLFENAMIRVGISSTVVHDNTNHKNMLKLVLYFENKSDQLIEEFLTDFSQAKGLNRIAKPGRLETFIDSGKQVKQQVIVAFDKIPFECLQLYATVRAVENGPETFSLFLPTLITKFMEFKYVNADVFRERWKLKSSNILRSEEIIVNSAILKTAYDFKKYFGYLVDLKPMDEYDFVQGKKSIKLGGLFELDVPNTEYLLKINVLPNHQVVFQIASFETESNNASFLLQALVFLFKKP